MTTKLENYKVQLYNATPEFHESQTCYGERDVSKSKLFDAQEIANLPFFRLGTYIRQVAAEAAEIKQAQILRCRTLCNCNTNNFSLKSFLQIL